MSLDKVNLVESEIPQEDDVTSDEVRNRANYQEENLQSPTRYPPYPQTQQPWNVQQAYSPPPYSGQSNTQTIVVNSNRANPTLQEQQDPSTLSGLYCIMGFSIFSCLCCIWPIGLVAMILSISAVNTYKDDPRQGVHLSKIALGFMIVSILGGIALLIWLFAFGGIYNFNGDY
jgi:hypothetical protein